MRAARWRKIIRWGGDGVTIVRSQAVGFQQTGGSDPWSVVEEAAATAGLGGAVALGFWGSAGFWLYARQDLSAFASDLARRVGAGVRWYSVSLAPDPQGESWLETSGMTATPDGQVIPLSGTRDRSALDEIPTDPGAAADEALEVLLELHEGLGRDDGWKVQRVL